MLKSFNILRLGLILAIIVHCFTANAGFAEAIKSAQIKVGSISYNLATSRIVYQGDTLSYWESPQPHVFTTLELELQPGYELLGILEARDFQVLDTIVQTGTVSSVRIEFLDLARYYVPQLRFQLRYQGKISIQVLSMYAWVRPDLSFSKESIELFTGEEYSLKLDEGFAQVYEFPSQWTKCGNAEYKGLKQNGDWYFSIHSDFTGEQLATIPLVSTRPYYKDGRISYDLGEWKVKLSVKPSRIVFLNSSPAQFFFDPGTWQTEEIQLDYHRGIELNRLYRIEDRPESGGRLIAEWIPKSFISGNKVMGTIRFYSLHKSREGYLYLKENDQVKYMTNFRVFEQPKLEKFSILRAGEDWTTQSAVYPGEEIEVRFEGKGLRKGEINFQNCISRKDTVRLSDELMYYFVRIPANVKERKVSIFLRDKITTFELLVREHQVPRDFDYVTIDYNGKAIKATDKLYSKPVVYPEAIGDINIGFLPEVIDQSKIYGKQYLRVEVKIQNAKGDLLEVQYIEPIVVCPGESSPRYASYDLRDCKRGLINLNDYLQHKTYDLEGWSKIELVIKHMDARYTQPGFVRRIVFLKEKKFALDLQVSFPTGMLVKRFNQTGVGNLTGISTSVIAQFSFYDPKRIGRLLPYQIGAGFIAVDAFSFNSNSANSNKDLGLVVLGSLHPLRKDKKFSFPIFAGAGYLLKNNTMFLVFGPGVQFNF